jgi:hypothetical protein
MYQRYCFFKEHAGWSTPPGRAASALALARAEVLLEQAIELGIAEVEWEHDDQPYDTDCYSDDEIAAKFESNEWTGPFGCRIGLDEDKYAASLWGIVLDSRGVSTGLPGSADDPYARVVRAELADELEDDLRQAIGDALDAAVTPLI